MLTRRNIGATTGLLIMVGLLMTVVGITDKG